MNTLNIPVEVKAGGRYKLIRRKADGTVVEETPWCKNLFTLYYFNQAMTVGSLKALGCVVGTGNAAPAETDTVLQSYLAKTVTIQAGPTKSTNTTVSPRWVRKTITFRFGLGVAAGNVAEVGITLVGVLGSISSVTPIISRALVVDGLGAPTTVTVLSDEYLDVIWEATWFVPEDVAGSCSMTLDGVPTTVNYTCRAYGMDGANWGGIAHNIGAYPPLIGAGNTKTIANESATLLGYTSLPSIAGTNPDATSQTPAAYVADSKQRSYTIAWGLNNGNFATGIGLICIAQSDAGGGSSSFGSFQFSLSPKIMKTALKVFSVNVTLAMSNAP